MGSLFLGDVTDHKTMEAIKSTNYVLQNLPRIYGDLNGNHKIADRCLTDDETNGNMSDEHEQDSKSVGSADDLIGDDSKYKDVDLNNDTPSYILYHFKTIYDDENDASRVVLNWKNLQWQQEQVYDNHWHVDRSKTFRVIFRLHEDCIKMFVNSVDHPPDYEFSVQLPLDQIESIELWDDVENVEEISFRYDNRTPY
uniref:Galectin n=1 Tax=Anopheles maculatus TaxID=74869 RepID=A0A182TAD0_9DIPT